LSRTAELHQEGLEKVRTEQLDDAPPVFPRFQLDIIDYATLFVGSLGIGGIIYALIRNLIVGK
jgi:hypothetical protein